MRRRITGRHRASDSERSGHTKPRHSPQHHLSTILRNALLESRVNSSSLQSPLNHQYVHGPPPPSPTTLNSPPLLDIPVRALLHHRIQHQWPYHPRPSTATPTTAGPAARTA